MYHSKQTAKLAMILLSALLLLCKGIGDVHCAKPHENSVDLHALLDFRGGITNDPHGALGDWSNDTHFCLWNGVSCTTTRPFRVTWLYLARLDLAGKITSSLGNLTFLTRLDLGVNNFVGHIPVLGHLQQLQTVYLQSNHLSGMIPHSLTNCSKLANLYLSSNLLEGHIPPNLGSLSALSYLNLFGNSLVGIIPSELGLLSILDTVDLRDNLLVGQIPPKLGLLSNLQYLDLSVNLLVGQIPPTLGLLSNLEYMSLESNQLEGSIPGEIGQLVNLQKLKLRDNKLSGELP